MLFRGMVTRVTPVGVYVQVPSMWPGVELGPCEQVQPLMAAASTGTASSHSHSIPGQVAVLIAGDRVVVGQFDDGDFVIVGRRV